MAGGGGGRGGKRKRPSGKTVFKPKGKKQVKDKEVFKRRKYARNNYVLQNKVRPKQALQGSVAEPKLFFRIRVLPAWSLRIWILILPARSLRIQIRLIKFFGSGSCAYIFRKIFVFKVVMDRIKQMFGNPSTY